MTVSISIHDSRLVALEAKLSRLMRYHRQNVFLDNEAAADRHCRALRRLKSCQTFRAVCGRNKEAEDHRRSEELLRMYA